MKERIKIAGILALALGFLIQPRSMAQNMKDSSKTIYICAIMRPQKDKAEELRNSLLSLVRPTRAEEGCITYNVYAIKDGELFLYEVWRSQEDLDKHFQKSYLKDFVGKADSLLDGKNDAHFGKLISTAPDSKGTAKNVRDTATTVTICSVKRPKSGKAEELRKSLLSLVKPTQAEEGCITYDIYEEADGSLFMVEVWRSQKDLEKHLQQPYLKDFRSRADSLLEKNEIHFGTQIPVSEE